ncbi:MAG: A24 family peptidase [Actinomycetota bacterium]|nr:A24 family peptidase [Actinomycetota bacterium]
MTARRSLPALATPGRITATGAVAGAVETTILWRFGWSPPLGAYLVFGAAATAVSATDIAARRVADGAVLTALVSGAAFLALASGFGAAWWPLARAGIAMVVLAGFYLTLGLAFPSGMGMGDVKWAAVTGLFLGWISWPAVATGTLVAFAGAALFVVVRHVAAPRRRRAVLAMAPFMAAGALAAILLVR